MQRHLRASIPLVAALLALSAVSAGCGSSPTQTSTTAEGSATPTSEPTVFALISDTDALSTMAAGIGAADLVKRFESTGPYTVFAPTNDAWEKLGTDRMEALMTTDSKNLRQGLLNHMVKGRLMSADLTDGQRLKSLGGPQLVVRVKDGTITVGGAKVMTPDQTAGNGVVHVIDKVIR